MCISSKELRVRERTILMTNLKKNFKKLNALNTYVFYSSILKWTTRKGIREV